MLPAWSGLFKFNSLNKNKTIRAMQNYPLLERPSLSFIFQSDKSSGTAVLLSSDDDGYKKGNNLFFVVFFFFQEEQSEGIQHSAVKKPCPLIVSESQKMPRCIKSRQGCGRGN